MTYLQEELRSDLNSLKQSFSDLSDQLVESATEMREHGLPPKVELAPGIEQARRGFDQLCERTRSLALSLGSIPESAAEQLNSLKEIERLASQIAWHLTRQQAERALCRVLSLEHSGHADYQPLQACQTQARTILDQLNAAQVTLPYEAEALARGEHAFAHLLQIIDRREELDEDQLIRLQDSVINGLDSVGKSLSIAALLGKLTLPVEAPPPSSPPEPELTSELEETLRSQAQPAEPRPAESQFAAGHSNVARLRPAPAHAKAAGSQFDQVVDRLIEELSQAAAIQLEIPAEDRECVIIPLAPPDRFGKSIRRGGESLRARHHAEFISVSQPRSDASLLRKAG
ncbi:MAG: hypothetical protein ACREBD_07410 [Blastocatellia bacterium]